MSDNTTVKDASGATVTIRSRDNGAGVQTQLFGSDAASQVDGHSTTIGATTDAAVTSNTTGSLSAKLRGLVAILADVWDSTNHQLKIAVTSQIISQTSAVTRVAASTTTVALFTTNTAAIRRTIYNDSTSICYVKLGTGATTTSFSNLLEPRDANGVGGYWLLPDNWVGPVEAVWAAANGAAQVTELT